MFDRGWVLARGYTGTLGRLTLGAGVVVMALSCAAGVSAAGAKGGAAAKPVLTIAFDTAPQSLDPARDASNAHFMRRLTNEPIIRLAPDGKFRSALATSWRYLGRGNKDFEFTLRKNARFSDGTPVTAQAVKTWFEYFVKAAGPYATRMGSFRSIETVGKWTVRVHLRTPHPAIPFVIGDNFGWGAVSSPNAVAEPTVLSKQTFGAGPYALVPSQTVAGDHYTFVPNKFYYDKSKIRFSKVVVKVIINPTSRLQAMQTGQVDVAMGDPSTVAAAVSAGLTVAHAPFAVTTLMLTDKSGTVSPPLADVRVRQALNYAVDRKALTAAFAGKFGLPTSEIPSSDGWDPKYRDYYPYNPAKARSLLAAAGYRDGFTLDVLTGLFGTLGAPVVQGTAKYFDAVGVKLKITVPSTQGDFVRNILSKSFPVTNQFMITARSMWEWYNLCMKPNVLFNTRWHDPVIDRLWLKGQRAADPSKYWVQVARRATEQAHFIPLFTYHSSYYASKKIGGVSVTERGVFPNPPDWFPK